MNDNKNNNITNKIIEAIIAFLMGSIIVIIFLQVFFRYVLKNPLGWTGEAACYLFVWMIFIGTYRLLRDREHMCIDILFKKLGTNWQKICSIVYYLLLIPLASILMIYGFSFAKKFIFNYSPALQLPLGWIYSILPITGFLFLILAIENILKIIITFRSKKN